MSSTNSKVLREGLLGGGRGKVQKGLKKAAAKGSNESAKIKNPRKQLVKQAMLENKAVLVRVPRPTIRELCKRKASKAKKSFYVTPSKQFLLDNSKSFRDSKTVERVSAEARHKIGNIVNFELQKLLESAQLYVRKPEKGQRLMRYMIKQYILNNNPTFDFSKDLKKQDPIMPPPIKKKNKKGVLLPEKTREHTPHPACPEVFSMKVCGIRRVIKNYFTLTFSQVASDAACVICLYLSSVVEKVMKNAIASAQARGKKTIQEVDVTGYSDVDLASAETKVKLIKKTVCKKRVSKKRVSKAPSATAKGRAAVVHGGDDEEDEAGVGSDDGSDDEEGGEEDDYDDDDLQ